MGNQTPNINGSEERISQLLSALPRVEAPGDFGFRVNSRIASGKPSEARPFWLPIAAKAALPVMLMAVVGGYFGFSAIYPGGDTQLPVTAQQFAPETQTPPIVAQEPSMPSKSQIELATVPAEPVISKPAAETIAATTTKKPVRTAPVPTPDGKSYDEAAPITQKLTPNEGTTKQPEMTSTGSQAGEVLIRIGVNALFGESGWKAESVKPNTAAAKAGIKAGDVIQAVDDQTMTDLGSVAKPAKGKKIRVLREGKSVDIVIEP